MPAEVVLLVEKELAHYRIPIFAHLNEQLGGELVVVHGDPPPRSALATAKGGERLSFRHRRIRNRWMAGGSVYLQNPLRIVRLARQSRVAVFRHSIRNLGLLPILLVLRVLGIPSVVWGQGHSKKRKFRPSSHLVDRFHLAIVATSDAYVCYTEEILETLEQHVPVEKLFVARNTLDVRSLLETYSELDQTEGRAGVRRRLALDRACYLCFSGRLQPRKRLEDLLDVHVSVRRDHGMDAGLLIIGDGPERDALEQRVREEGTEGVRFLGEMYGREAAEYLFASDVMVMPGAIGLAAVHGLAMGLPVLGRRTDPGVDCHGPEAAYVESCVAGRMLEGESIQALAVAAIEALNRREEMGDEARRFVKEQLTVDRMGEGFLAAIRYAEGRHADRSAGPS